MPFRRCVPKLRLTATTIILSIGDATTAYADMAALAWQLRMKTAVRWPVFQLSLNLGMATSIKLRRRARRGSL
jgi:hypothetical protein